MQQIHSTYEIEVYNIDYYSKIEATKVKNKNAASLVSAAKSGGFFYSEIPYSYQKILISNIILFYFIREIFITIQSRNNCSNFLVKIPNF